MTDEVFVYQSDVNERANVAKLSKNRMRKGGCTLSSDNMSHWAKKRKNGSVIIMSPDRPILYDDFKELSEESQKEYLQSLIDNHGGTTERIAKMFGISEAKTKNHRQLLGVVNNTIPIDPVYSGLKWTEFLCAGDFLKEPMSYAEFKKLSNNEKKYYLTYIRDELDGSPSEVATLFGTGKTHVLGLYKKYGIPSHGKGYRYGHIKWNEWVAEYDAHCGVHQIDDNEYEGYFIEPAIEIPENAPTEINSTEMTDTEQTPIEIRDSEIPYLNLIMTVKDYDQIFEILKTIPKAERGTITFTFGKEEKE